MNIDLSTEAQIGLLSLTVNDFAKHHDMTVETKFDGYWEGIHSPSLLMRCETVNGIHCLMKIMPSLTAYSSIHAKWNFFIGAWIDKEDGRHGKSIMLKEKVKFMEIANNLDALLNQGYKLLTNLKEEELELIP
jgi:hypothetical protein